MNISRVSNTGFKGAYIIQGPGMQVNKVEEDIKKIKKGDVQVERLGHGYTSNEMNAYILVTTGEDTAKYNKFAKKQQAYYEKELEADPEKPRSDFDTLHEHLAYRIRHTGEVWIRTIAKNCNFKDGLKIIEAENYKRGMIE